MINFAPQITVDTLLNVVKVVFHLSNVIEIRFCKNWVSTLWYKFYLIKFWWISRTRVEIQEWGGFPGKKNMFIYSQYLVCFTKCEWEIYSSSISMCFITELMHLTHIQLKKWRSLLLSGWNLTFLEILIKINNYLLIFFLSFAIQYIWHIFSEWGVCWEKHYTFPI